MLRRSWYRKITGIQIRAFLNSFMEQKKGKKIVINLWNMHFGVFWIHFENIQRRASKIPSDIKKLSRKKFKSIEPMNIQRKKNDKRSIFACNLLLSFFLWQWVSNPQPARELVMILVTLYRLKRIFFWTDWLGDIGTSYSCQSHIQLFAVRGIQTIQPSNLPKHSIYYYY